MKFFGLAAAVSAAIPATIASMMVNTPLSVVECQPTLLSWQDGQAPYYLTFIPPGQPSASPIKSFPAQTGTQVTWIADLPANSVFAIALKDSSGTQVYSSNVTVQAGSSTSCVNTSVQETATGGGSSPASTGSSGSTPTGSSSAAGTSAGTSAGSSTLATSTPSGSSPSASASASATGTSSSTSGAGRLSVASAIGVAGIMGLVGATLF